MFKKNTAVPGFAIGNFIRTADGVVITEGAVSARRMLDGVGGDCVNAASYNSAAYQWEIDLTAADLNADAVGLNFTLADCLPISYSIKTYTGVLNEIVEGSWTLGMLFRIALSALAGKSYGGGGNPLRFRGLLDDKDRITATVDEHGNRTSVTLDGS